MVRVIQRASLVHSSRGESRAPVTLDDFQTIYRENYVAIWRFLLHLGVRRNDVADVTHNVFLVAYRKLGTFEQRSSIRTWLSGIALRVARDFQKSAAVRLEVYADDPAFADDVSSDDSLEMRRDGKLELAHRLLDQLPAEQREVFVLHELEQMSGSEIATLLGTPIGTVRSRLRRARESFRKQLGELGEKGTPDV
jgi:RNA polymerase sigma-70 factor (ECF subfamily)